jgi:hypothetical protein
MQADLERRRAGLRPDIVDGTVAALLLTGVVVAQSGLDGACRQSHFDDDDLSAAAGPVALWFFVSAAIVWIQYAWRVVASRFRSEPPRTRVGPLQRSTAALLISLALVQFDHLSSAHLDTQVSSRVGSCTTCDADGWDRAPDHLVAALTGAALLQIVLLLIGAAGAMRFKADSWSSALTVKAAYLGPLSWFWLEDVDSQVVTLVSGGITAIWSANLIGVLFDVSSLGGVVVGTLGTLVCSLGTTAVALWLLYTASPVTDRAWLDRSAAAVKRVDLEDARQLQWRHGAATLLHSFSLVVALQFRLREESPDLDTNSRRAFAQYNVLFDDILYVDAVVIACHLLRIVMWRLQETRGGRPGGQRLDKNPWRFDAWVRILEYTLTAGVLLLEFNYWCAWQDEDSGQRDWGQSAWHVSDGHFYTIMALNAALQIAGSAHEFSQRVLSDRLSYNYYGISTLLNVAAYVLLVALFGLTFFNTHYTPGSSRIIPLDQCGTDTPSCLPLVHDDREAAARIQSAWRFLACSAIVLYLAFGAVDAVRDPHQRALLFTELGCFTKIGLSWAIVILKTAATPISTHHSVTSYPWVFLYMLLPAAGVVVAFLAARLATRRAAR